RGPHISALSRYFLRTAVLFWRRAAGRPFAGPGGGSRRLIQGPPLSAMSICEVLAMKWVWSVGAALLCLAASARGEGVENLVKQLKDPEASTRRAAAKALGEAGPGAKEAVGALADALKDNDAFVRRFAAQAL